MKYEENVWYGWNGGECPVHPETVVEVHTYGKSSGSNENLAFTFSWYGPDTYGDTIIAFRVIKEREVPREFWLHMGSIWNNRKDLDDYVEAYDLDKFEIIHVKEVLE